METLIHNLDILLSLAALVVAIVALVFALKAKKISLAVARASAGGNRVLQEGKATVTVHLVKHPSDTNSGRIGLDYRFWISNNSMFPAYNIDFQVDTRPSLVAPAEMSKIPCESLHPGDTLELQSKIGLSSPKEFRTILSWENPDGTAISEEYWLSREIEQEY